MADKQQRIRLEPAVKELALKINNQFKRTRNMIPKRPKLALIHAVLTELDILAKEVGEDGITQTG